MLVKTNQGSAPASEFYVSNPDIGTFLEYVKSFADVGAVLDSLQKGKIVVFTLRNEPDIEYLIL